jgi:hypothetical protein
MNYKTQKAKETIFLTLSHRNGWLSSHSYDHKLIFDTEIETKILHPKRTFAKSVWDGLLCIFLFCGK